MSGQLTDAAHAGSIRGECCPKSHELAAALPDPVEDLEVCAACRQSTITCLDIGDMRTAEG